MRAGLGLRRPERVAHLLHLPDSAIAGRTEALARVLRRTRLSRLVRARRRMLLMSLVLAAMAACARPGTVDQVALRAAVGKEPVVLLSAAWCGYCRKLRTQL